MPDILDDATRSLFRASRVASAAARFLRDQMLDAQESGRHETAARLRSAYRDALRAERDANGQVVAALVNQAKVARLTDRTAELEERLERLREDEEELDELAQALGFLTGAIGLLI